MSRPIFLPLTLSAPALLATPVTLWGSGVQKSSSCPEILSVFGSSQLNTCLSVGVSWRMIQENRKFRRGSVSSGLARDYRRKGYLSKVSKKLPFLSKDPAIRADCDKIAISGSNFPFFVASAQCSLLISVIISTAHLRDLALIQYLASISYYQAAGYLKHPSDKNPIHYAPFLKDENLHFQC